MLTVDADRAAEGRCGCRDGGRVVAPAVMRPAGVDGPVVTVPGALPGPADTFDVVAWDCGGPVPFDRPPRTALEASVPLLVPFRDVPVGDAGALPVGWRVVAVNDEVDGPLTLTALRRHVAAVEDGTSGRAEVCVDVSAAVSVGGVAFAVKVAERMADRVALVSVGNAGGRRDGVRLPVADLDALARVVDVVGGAVGVLVTGWWDPPAVGALRDQVRRVLPDGRHGCGCVPGR